MRFIIAVLSPGFFALLLRKTLPLLAKSALSSAQGMISLLSSSQAVLNWSV